MIIDINSMFNYQIINNNSLLVGMIHSYREDISKEHLKKGFILYRKNKMAATIIKAVLVEE